MIQLNLLPDIKIAFMRSRRLKRLVMMVASIISIISISIVVLLYSFVNIAQKQHISNINSNIKSNDSKLGNITDLNKVLTIQNQLESLTELHDQKPAISRLFGYINSITPAKVDLSTLSIDFTNKTLKITGSSDSLNTLNKFIDTIKFTVYSTPYELSDKKAFSSTVLTSYSKEEKRVTYAIGTTFDPAIFDGRFVPILKVPKIISSRSETEKPTTLFQGLGTEKATP